MLSMHVSYIPKHAGLVPSEHNAEENLDRCVVVHFHGLESAFRGLACTFSALTGN